jgi:hypothetical protein
VHRLAKAVLLSFFAVGVTPVPQSLTEYGGLNQNRQGVFTDLTLTPSNVSAATFGLLHTITLDGPQIHAQPLFVQGVTIGSGTFDLIIVATMNNTVWAVDANALSVVWETNFGATYNTYPRYNVTQNNFYEGSPVGCMSTPAVDRARGLVFVVCAGSGGGLGLHELSLSTGAKLNAINITAQYPGTGDSGDTVIDGELQFFAAQHEQRTGLVLANGNIYVAFSSYNDQHPWHGWVISYAESSLVQQAVYCTTPNGYGGGIWMSGDAPAVDSAGNLYVSTGNGDYDGTANFGNSVIKLSPSLTVLDWFTPSNWMTLESQDIDVSGGRIMLVGDGTLLDADRDYRQYVLSTTCMGHLQGSSCNPQLVTVPGSGAGIYGGLYFNGQIFVSASSGSIYNYSYANGAMAGSPTSSTSATFGHPGARVSLGVNGYNNAVLWATTSTSSALYAAQPGVLRAFNPATLMELYNSTTNSGDALGTFPKFNVPMIVGGYVFVANWDGQLQVYGLK